MFRRFTTGLAGVDSILLFRYILHLSDQLSTRIYRAYFSLRYSSGVRDDTDVIVQKPMSLVKMKIAPLTERQRERENLANYHNYFGDYKECA